MLTWWKDFYTQDVLFTKAINKLRAKVQTGIEQATVKFDQESAIPIVMGLRKWDWELGWAIWVSKPFIPRLWFFGDPLNTYQPIHMLLPDILENLQKFPDAIRIAHPLYVTLLPALLLTLFC